MSAPAPPAPAPRPARRALAGLALLAGAALAVAALFGPHRGGPPPAVVTVLGPASAEATGFAAGPGRVVTVAHALGPGAIAVRDSRRVVRRARLLRADRERDLAVLAVPGLRAARVRIAAARAGAPVRIVRPGGPARAGRVRRRLLASVGALDGSSTARDALELAVAAEAGDSGAPVVTDDGRVAGVVFARSEARASTAYAVHASAIEALVGR